MKTFLEFISSSKEVLNLEYFTDHFPPAAIIVFEELDTYFHQGSELLSGQGARRN